MLVTPELGAYYHTAATGCDARIGLEVAKTASTAAADQERDRKIATADQKAARAEGRLEGYEAGRPSWYTHPVFVAFVTAGAVVGMFWVVKRVDRATD